VEIDAKTLVPAAIAMAGALGFGGFQTLQVDQLEVVMAGYEEASKQADERAEFCERLLLGNAGIVIGETQ